MGYEFVRYLGESLGNRVQAKLIYLFLAYQIIISALVFLFDSGFSPWMVIAGWFVFIFLLAVQVLIKHIAGKRDEKKELDIDQLRLHRISRLKERLKTDPGLQTRCSECKNKGTDADPCHLHSGLSEREFRFRSNDVQSYCLLWSPGREGKST